MYVLRLLNFVLYLYIVVEILFIIHDIYNIFCSTFSLLTISRDEITYIRGWLNKKTTTIPSNKIRTCSKRSSILQRACGTMNISITTAGDHSEIIFYDIENGDIAYELICKLAKCNE
ncbi:MAG: PH domain-containing protein [Clostridia bacterium]